MRSRDILLGSTPEGHRVFLPPALRRTHLHVVGASGRGKSKFLEGMIRRDILNGEGLCLIDPHGTLYREIIRWCETKGIERRIHLFDPSLDGWVCGFNPLQFRSRSRSEVSYAVDAMIEACAHVWGGEDQYRTPRLRKCLKALLYTLAEHQLTLLEALFLIDSNDRNELRTYLTERVEHPVIRQQWAEFNAMSPREFREMFESSTNRLMEFVSTDIISTSLGQEEATIDFATLMREGGVVLVNLAPHGKLSPASARLLGTLIVNDLLLKAQQRSEKQPRPFYLYIDECALFINGDIGRILEECRKFGLHLILSHQRLAQLRDEGERVYESVLGGAQAKVIFGGLSVGEATTLAENAFAGFLDLQEPKQFRPAVTGYRRIWLENYAEAVTDSWSTTDTETWNEGETATYDFNLKALTSASQSYGGGAAVTEAQSTTKSTGRSEAREAVVEWLPEFYSREDQVYKAMALLVNQPTRQAIIKFPGLPPCKVKTPFVEDAVANDNRVADYTRSLQTG